MILLWRFGLRAIVRADPRTAALACRQVSAAVLPAITPPTAIFSAVINPRLLITNSPDVRLRRNRDPDFPPLVETSGLITNNMAKQNQNNQFGSPLQDQPPQNLPTGRGLPPLASASQRPSPTSKLEREWEDILDEVNKTKPEIEGPAMSGPDLSAPMRPAVALPEKAEMREPFIKQHKKIFVAIGLVVMIGGVLALGGWYGYQLFFAGSFESLGQSVNLSNTQIDINQALNLNQPAVNQNLNPEPPPPQPLDTDRDGLTDEEEALYGTDLT